jgi:dihydrofolate reductase
MGRVRVSSFSISLDGFGAGPDQTLEQPLGRGGFSLHQWLYDTKTFHEITGADGGETGPDDDLAAAGLLDIGAWIMGRNMFGPIRGPWPDESWTGWWGDNPPYHTPVFVLTHHARAPLSMDGGTVFHFVTDGIHAALDRAREAAGDRDIRVGGGPCVIRQYLTAGLIDEVHVAVSPVMLGSGEPMLQGIDLPALGYRVEHHLSTHGALHVMLGRGTP